MFVMAKELVGALKAAKLFASEDETRSHMNCVHVEAVGSALRFVSTDGHTLWCCEIPARDSAADPAPMYQTPWNVQLADIDAIAKALKDRLEVEVLLPKRTIVDAGVELGPYMQRSENFSPYAAVVTTIADTKPGKLLPEFAASYVARCCEAFTHYSRAFAIELPKKGTKLEKRSARDQRNGFMDPPIAWRCGAELDPAIFYSPKFPCAFAIVMPRRGENLSSVIVESFLNRVRTKQPRAA